MTETSEGSPAAGFAALMSSAAEAAGADAPEAPEAPYGYTTTRDGVTRPKKTPGRPRKSATLDELKAPPEDAGAAAGGSEPPRDRAPDDRRRRMSRGKTPKAEAPAPAYRPGVITAGVNKLYRRAGKIVRAMDHDIGTAIIESAKNTADDGTDDSVGAAWDELCKTNPRIRRFIMKCLAGGAWGQLVMAHAPIALAIAMKPAVLKLIPFHKLVESLAEPDESTPAGEGGLPGGMTETDVQQMQALAQAQAEKMARSLGISVPPEVAEQAMRMAMANGGPPVQPSAPPPAPPGYTRQQPRRPAARAKRHT